MCVCYFRYMSTICPVCLIYLIKQLYIQMTQTCFIKKNTQENLVGKEPKYIKSMEL